MDIKEEILDLLNNPDKLTNEFDENSDYVKKLTESLNDTFRMIIPAGRMQFVVESSAYALAKAMERKLLLEIRPTSPHFWIVIMEIAEGPKFNLPAHLEDKLFDYMDACENAVEEYIGNNLGFSFPELLVRLQKIGAYFVDAHDLKNINAGGLTNDKIMTRDEMFNFCLQGATKALEERGYKILKVFPGYAQPVSILCEQGGITYATAVTCAILPKTGEFGGWKLNEFEKTPTDDKHKLALLGVSIISTDELYASMGIVIKEGEYNFKVSPLETIKKRSEL